MQCEARRCSAKMRAWLRCGAALALLAAAGASGCGDDDDEHARAREDASTGDAGDDRPDAASARPPITITVTGGQAVAGVCLLKLASVDTFSRCTGLDHYESCARRQCDLELCIDQCSQYLNCLRASPVACDDACVPEGACGTCMSEVAQCALRGTCVEAIACAEQVEGGYCDQLRSCCNAQPEQDLREECMTLAEVSATLEGERTCRTLLGTLPMLDTLASVDCPVQDAGPPQR